MRVKPIAIYLPQFHPIPENDEAWGKGFTEWTNVTKAQPLFEGHNQPHLPADLGFYDLRVPETREDQAKLAKEYGIYGFCYYHYWFNGRRLLERPFQEVFDSGKPDFPFMLCWANENWTKTWDGDDKQILIEQKYSFDDDREHIKFLIPYFKDKRYIKVNGKPLIAIYKPTLLPDVTETLKIWRTEAIKEGIELLICFFEAHGLEGEKYIKTSGFDRGIDFQPLGTNMWQFRKQQKTAEKQKIFSTLNKNFLIRFSRRLFNKKYQVFVDKKIKTKFAEIAERPIDYDEYVNFCISQPFPKYDFYPGISPMWDNSARKKKNNLIITNSSPETYKKWFHSIIKKYTFSNSEENFVFINAWNEWAEGNHLEPCRKWGRRYLEATHDVVFTENSH